MMHPLSNVYLWEGFRALLDASFGLYRKRLALLARMGITGEESVLDIGCGTGHYAALTRGPYFGLDLDARYIEFARRAHPDKEFACINVSDLKLHARRFEVSLLVDVIHHLDDGDVRGLCHELLRVTSDRAYFLEPVVQSPGNRVGHWFVSRDRGNFVRPKADLLKLLGEFYTLQDVRDLKLGPIETVCVLGRPKVALAGGGA